MDVERDRKMKILQAVWVKDGDAWRIERWDVVGHVPDGLTGGEAIDWAKANGHRAPVLEA
jgi:hypothetical protein